jgi:TM2 domain-containing membrane protein YozV
MSYNVVFAYILYFLSGFGMLGLHRFYLGKIGTGVLWLCTGGMGFLGSIYDFFTLPAQVREANLRGALRQSLDLGARPGIRYVSGIDEDTYKRRDSIEKVILRAAKLSGGFVTPGSVALDGDVALEEARTALDKMAKNGFAEMRVRESGVIEYFFAEFARDKGGYAL